MNARIVAVFLLLGLSSGYSLKNDDVDDDILDMLQETDKLKEAPEMKEDHLADRTYTMITDHFTLSSTVSSSSVQFSSSSWPFPSVITDHFTFWPHPTTVVDRNYTLIIDHFVTSMVSSSSSSQFILVITDHFSSSETSSAHPTTTVSYSSASIVA